MSEIKRIDIAEFRRLGYLQEVNRCFLHPLGLALEVVVSEDGSERLGGIWDYRDDPEGIYFAGEADADRANFVTGEFKARGEARLKALGFVVEPIGGGS